jgi:hypothetical protein
MVKKNFCIFVAFKLVVMDAKKKPGFWVHCFSNFMEYFLFLTSSFYFEIAMGVGGLDFNW